VTEADWQKSVIDLAQRLGWRVAHFRTAPTQSGHWATPVGADGKGFPDLVLVRHRVLYRELKADRGQLRPDQRTWLAALEAAGEDVAVWRPRDFEELVQPALMERPT
jgi:hypothetical protein